MDYMTTEEVMKEFRVSRRTVYRWRKAGVLVPVSSQGRRLLFDRAQVEALRGGIEDEYMKLLQCPTHNDFSLAEQYARTGYRYANIAGAMEARNVTYAQLAQACGRDASEIAESVEYGYDSLTIGDAIKIREMLGDLSLEWLFTDYRAQG